MLLHMFTKLPAVQSKCGQILLRSGGIVFGTKQKKPKRLEQG